MTGYVRATDRARQAQAMPVEPLDACALGPTSHVKITDHFLAALESRPMGPEASLDLWKLIAGRDLHRITAELYRGQRGALAVAGDGAVHLVIFCRDECDPAVCALLTVLSENEAQVVARRRDTVLRSL